MAARTWRRIKVPTIQHVKGHQDNDKTHTLTWAEKLNIEADKLATEYPNREQKYHKIGEIPMLWIGASPITSKTEDMLRDEIDGASAREFIRGKMKITPAIAHNIDWKAHAKAIGRLSPGEKFTISRFIHNWLPTGKRTHRNDARISHKCPMCSQDNEDNAHLLRCKNRMVQTRRTDLMANINKFLKDSQCAPALKIVIPDAILRWLRGEKPKCVSTTKQGHDLWEAQQSLGWDQFFKGRVHYKFGDLQEAYQVIHHHKQNDGAQWASKLIAIIWRWVHTTWLARNEVLHGKTITEQTKIKRQHIIDRVKKCYDKQRTLPWQIRQRMKTQVSDKIREPTAELKAWLVAIEAAIKRTTDRNDGQRRIPAMFKEQDQ